jgi:hypothetical protein
MKEFDLAPVHPPPPPPVASLGPSGSSLVTTHLMCRWLSSILGPRYMVEIAIP